MDNTMQNLLEKVRYGEPVNRGNLTLYPLFVDVPDEASSYLLLEEAMKMGCLEVEEMSESGNVNKIIITNQSDQAVLILDGDEIIGAKQNRIVNASILVAAGDRREVPVSCVEKGRWSKDSKQFTESGAFGYSTLRGQKSRQVYDNLKQSRQFSTDQSAIWAEIERKQNTMSTKSETGAMHSIYLQYQAELENIASTLEPLEGQKGIAVFINNNFVCIDLFEHPDILKKLWKKLLKSYAMEALEFVADLVRIEDTDLGVIIKALKSCSYDSYPSVGLGLDLRISDQGLVGSGLTLEKSVLHLSIFKAE
jgi:hypothetical protein